MLSGRLAARHGSRLASWGGAGSWAGSAPWRPSLARPDPTRPDRRRLPGPPASSSGALRRGGAAGSKAGGARQTYGGRREEGDGVRLRWAGGGPQPQGQRQGQGSDTPPPPGWGRARAPEARNPPWAGSGGAQAREAPAAEAERLHGGQRSGAELGGTAGRPGGNPIIFLVAAGCSPPLPPGRDVTSRHVARPPGPGASWEP